MEKRTMKGDNKAKYLSAKHTTGSTIPIYIEQ